MNAEQQMADLLQGWFEDEPTERPDRDEVVRNVLMRVRTTAQGRRRW